MPPAGHRQPCRAGRHALQAGARSTSLLPGSIGHTPVHAAWTQTPRSKHLRSTAASTHTACTMEQDSWMRGAAFCSSHRLCSTSRAETKLAFKHHACAQLHVSCMMCCGEEALQQRTPWQWEWLCCSSQFWDTPEGDSLIQAPCLCTGACLCPYHAVVRSGCSCMDQGSGCRWAALVLL